MRKKFYDKSDCQFYAKAFGRLKFEVLAKRLGCDSVSPSQPSLLAFAHTHTHCSAILITLLLSMVVLNKLIIDILQTYSPSSADKKFWNSKSFKDYVYPDQSKHKSGTHCGTKLRMRISMSIKVVCTSFFSSYSPPKIRLLILVPS